MKLDEPYLARRRFLCGMLGGGAATLAAGAAVPVVQFVLNRHPPPPPPFLEIAAADCELAPGASKIVMYGPIPALLLKTREPGGELKVFVATCTHFDCTVGFRPDENRIVCACHNGYYDLDGRVIGGPPPRPLPQFHQRFRPDKTLVIALEKDQLDRAFLST